MIDYKTPTQYLEDAIFCMKNDIEWYLKSNSRHVQLTDDFRTERIAELEQKLSAYEKAVDILKNSDTIDCSE